RSANGEDEERHEVFWVAQPCEGLRGLAQEERIAAKRRKEGQKSGKSWRARACETVPTRRLNRKACIGVRSDARSGFRLRRGGPAPRLILRCVIFAHGVLIFCGDCIGGRPSRGFEPLTAQNPWKGLAADKLPSR